MERAVYKMILCFAFVVQLSYNCITKLTESLILLGVGKEQKIEQKKTSALPLEKAAKA
jgi:hypothetical protein